MLLSFSHNPFFLFFQTQQTQSFAIAFHTRVGAQSETKVLSNRERVEFEPILQIDGRISLCQPTLHADA